MIILLNEDGEFQPTKESSPMGCFTHDEQYLFIKYKLTTYVMHTGGCNWFIKLQFLNKKSPCENKGRTIADKKYELASDAIILEFQILCEAILLSHKLFIVEPIQQPLHFQSIA